MEIRIKSVVHILMLSLGLTLASCNPLGTPKEPPSDFGLGANINIVSKTWDFSSASDYTYNSNYVEIASGSASLKTLDTTDSASDFSNGVQDGVSLSASNNLTIKNSFSVVDILPSRETSLVAYWRFDGDLTDSTGNGHDLAATGGAQATSFAKVGSRSLEITEGSQFVTDTGDESDFDFDVSDDFTIAFWINRDETDNDNIISKNGGSLGGAQGFAIFFQGSTLYIRRKGSCCIWSEIRMSGGVGINQWYHIVVIQESGVIKFYLNGVSRGYSSNNGATPNGPILNNLPLRMAYDSNASRRFGGNLDEVAIWSTALTTDDVSDLYSTQSKNYHELSSDWTPQYSSLKGYWKMDYNWNDSSGSGNNGSATGSPGFSTSSMVGSHAGQFNGTSAYVTANNALSPISSYPVSFSFWYKSALWADSVFGNQKVIVGSQSSNMGSVSNLWFYLRNSNIGFRYQRGGSDAVLAESSQLPDQWTHVTGVLTDSKIALYLNGELKQETAHAKSFTVLQSSNLKIGVSSAGAYFPGSIDDLAFWNVGLSSREVSSIYNRQKQKYVGMYTSQVFDTGYTSASWSGLSFITELPFMKELPGSSGSETSTDYVSLVGSTGSTSDNDLMNGLVGLWHLNNSTLDSSGNGRDLVNNNATYITNSLLGSHAAQFDGSGDYFDIPYGSGINPTTQDLTISLWVNATAISKQEIVFSSGIGIDDRLYVGLTDKGNGYKWDFGISSSNWAGDTARTDVTTGWSHLLITLSGTTASFYINGVLDYTKTYASYTLNQNFDIARNPTDGALDFTGYIDEVAIWSRSLHSSEVEQLYRRGANRLKLQIRSCDDSSCSGEDWIGPDDSNGEHYFSELNNCDTLLSTGICDYDGGGLVNLTSPDFSYPDFLGLTVLNNRYFQYRVLMESSDESATPTFPTLTSVSLGSTKYYGGGPEIITVSSQSLGSWTGFSAVTSGSCTPSYQVSLDKTNWNFFDGASWSAAVSADDSNTEATVNANASGFVSDVGTGPLFIKVFLNSDTSQDCILSELTLSGEE